MDKILIISKCCECHHMAYEWGEDDIGYCCLLNTKLKKDVLVWPDKIYKDCPLQDYIHNAPI